MSPFGTFEFANDPTMENFLKAMYMPAIVATGAAGAASLSTMPGQGISLQRFTALRADNVRTLAQFTAKTAVNTGRLAVRSVPVVTAFTVVAGMYMGVRRYFHHLASLDWVPDVYQV